MANPKQDTALSVKEWTEKWEPLTKGMDESKKALCSFVLENEVRYLNGLVEEQRNAEVGGALKFIFPITRRAMDLLPEGEGEYPQIYGVYKQAMEDVIAADEDQTSRCVTHDRPTAFESQMILSPLVERAHHAIERYKRIVKN